MERENFQFLKRESAVKATDTLVIKNQVSGAGQQVTDSLVIALSPDEALDFEFFCGAAFDINDTEKLNAATTLVSLGLSADGGASSDSLFVVYDGTQIVAGNSSTGRLKDSIGPAVSGKDILIESLDDLSVLKVPANACVITIAVKMYNADALVDHNVRTRISAIWRRLKKPSR